LIIIIGGVVVAVVLVFMSVILYSFYKLTRSIMGSIEATTKSISGISAYATDQVVKPLVQVAAAVQGIREGINWVGKLFKKREGGKDV